MAVLYKTNMLSFIFTETVREYIFRSTRTHFILIPSQPVFALSPKRRSNKYKFDGPYFDPTGTRTQNLPL